MDYTGITNDSPNLLSQALAEYEHLRTQNALLVIELGMREQEHLAFRGRHVECDDELKQLHEEGEKLERELKEMGMVEECEVVDKELSVRPSFTEGDADPHVQGTMPHVADAYPSTHPERQLRQSPSSVPAVQVPSPAINRRPRPKKTGQPPTQVSRDGEAFYRTLQEQGKIRSYDFERFYCSCVPPGQKPVGKVREGALHRMRGKSFCVSRWTDHARKCKTLKNRSAKDGKCDK